MSAETEEYVRLTARMFAGHESPADFERRGVLVQDWPPELIDTLDDTARLRAEGES